MFEYHPNLSYFSDILVARLLPVGSKRKRGAETVCNAVRVARNEGLNVFIKTTLERLKGSEQDNNFKSVPLETLFTPLSLPKFDSVSVSIIIPVYNKPVYTFNCIKSIIGHTSDTISYEVIVVDNASDSETKEMLDNIANLKCIKNEHNLGFVEACNIGALNSSGKYLLFLNNDTIVTDNWLSSLVETAEKDNQVGLGGAKLVYPDGRLQEAGGIIWNNKKYMGCNYGKHRDADCYEFNYVKEVDYCSGACILVKRDLFKRIGGFDRRYAPAYCEDGDLAFTIRSLGYKVVYQPQSKIIHFEGVTAGTDVSKGMKRFQDINQGKFYEKWKDVLEREHFDTNKNIFLARDRARSRKIILFIENNVPTYDRDAGSLTTYLYVKRFNDMGFKVIYMPHNLAKLEPYTEKLQQMGVEVMYGLFDFNKWIKQNGRYIDYVWLARPNVAINYIHLIRRHSSAKLLYYIHDLHYLREYRRYELEKDPKILALADKLKLLEFHIFRNVDSVLSISSGEAAVIGDKLPRKEVITIPVFYFEQLPVNKKIPPFEQRKDIIFLGGFAHSPNVDAVEYFAKDIFPLIKKKLGEVNFLVIGSDPPDKLHALAKEVDGISVIGYVKDIAPYFNSARIFVSPLRYGAGVKGKLVTSMSYGLPVVTTSIGSEGLSIADGEHCLIADTPEEFCTKVLALYANQYLWDNVSRNSIEYVKNNFSLESVSEAIDKILGKHDRF